MIIIERVEVVMKAAQELNFEEWLLVSKAITRAFVEKEHVGRKELKLSDISRIKYFMY